jgi:anti-sigma-K factor RskA
MHLLTGAYALDALDDVERAQFERHLRSCGSCAAEVIEFHAAAARLADRVRLPSPVRLRSHVLADANRTRQLSPLARIAVRRPSLRRALATACAAAMLAGSAGLGAVAWSGHRAGSDTVFTAARAVQALDQADPSNQADQTAPVSNVTTDSAWIEVVERPTSGTATAVADGAAILAARGLPALPPEKAYQVWLFDTKGVHAMGLLKPRDGSGLLLVPGAAAGSRVAVSVEPAGGSGLPTTAPVLNLMVA